MRYDFWIVNKSYFLIRESIRNDIIVFFFSFFTLYCKIAKMNCVVIIRRRFVCFRSFFCCWAIFSRFKNNLKLNRYLRLRVLRYFLKHSRIWAIFQNIERIIRLIAEHLHYVNASLTRRRRHASFKILWQRSFVDYFIHWIILRFQVQNAFQSRRLFFNQDFFYREAKRRCRRRDFFAIERLLSVNVEFVERRLLNIFKIYRVQNRFRASYVWNSIFLDYFDFALKWSNRMIVFAISTFSFIDEYFARWIIMRFDVNWTSSFMSTNLVDVIISLIIKALLDSTIVNEQLAWYLRILVQKFVFYQTINLLSVMNLHDQQRQFFFFINDVFWSDYSCNSQTRMQDLILLFNASNDFLLIVRLHVDHSHFMNQYFEDSRHRIRWRSNAFHQKIIDCQSILDFLRTSYQFHVFIEKMSCRHHILFHLLSSLQTFNKLFDEKHSQIVFFALLFYLED